MAVRGVNDIHVTPDERPAGRGERGLRKSALRVVVVLVGVVVATGANRDGREGEREQRRELHAGRYGYGCGCCRWSRGVVRRRVGDACGCMVLAIYAWALE